MLNQNFIPIYSSGGVQQHHEYTSNILPSLYFYNNMNNNTELSTRKSDSTLNRSHKCLHFLKQHTLMMEPSIYLEPYSNTTVIFSRNKSWRNIKKTTTTTSASFSPNNNYLETSHVVDLSNQNVSSLLPTSTVQSHLSHHHHHEQNQQLKRPHQTEIEQECSVNEIENTCTKSKGSFFMCLNGSEDEIITDQSSLKRKCVRPLKKQSQNGDMCELTLIRRTCSNNLNLSSGIQDIIDHCSSTDNSLPQSNVLHSIIDQEQILLNGSNASSVNKSLAVFTPDDNLEETADSQPIPQENNSSETNSVTINNSFECVKFMTPKRKSNRGRKPKPKKVNVSEGPWTEEEHELFIQGYRECGKNWSKIADLYVPSRSRTQIASHAQKWFRKQKNKN